MAIAIAQRLDRHPLRCMLFAGTACGVTLAAGFFALNASPCGLPCPADSVVTTAACVGTGIFTIGPLAAFASPR